MNTSEVLVQVQQAVPYALPAIMSGVALLHKRLGNFPIAKILVKYLTVWPILRIAVYELANAIVIQWGPEMPALIAKETAVVTNVINQHGADPEAIAAAFRKDLEAYKQVALANQSVTVVSPPVNARPVSPEDMQRKS